jgi:iron(III) transport system substrate-binding protein
MFLKRLFIFLLIISSSAALLSAAEIRRDLAAAIKEGNRDIDSTVSAPLVKEFETLYPGIKVDYIALRSGDIFSRNMNDIAARKVSADILWNSDITLQASLVKDGYALQYTPAENSALLPHANIGDSAFVTGFDPVVMVYNRNLVAEKELPLTKSSLVKVLPELRWRGKIGACDPEKSQLAFLLLTQDLAYGQNFWGLVRRLGDAGLKLYPDYRTLLERVASGEVMAAYNLPLSEVLKEAGPDKNIGWAYTTDYILAIPQTVLITKGAAHPNAARLWVEFIRSSQAQGLIAANSNLFPVRSDLAAGAMEKKGGTLAPWNTLKMIGTGTEVTRFGQSGLKRGFLLRWKQLLKLAK